MNPDEGRLWFSKDGVWHTKKLSESFTEEELMQIKEYEESLQSSKTVAST